MLISGILCAFAMGGITTTFDGLPQANDCIISYSVAYNNNQIHNRTNEVPTFNNTFKMVTDIVDEGGNYLFYVKSIGFDEVTRTFDTPVYIESIPDFNSYTYSIDTTHFAINYDPFDTDFYVTKTMLKGSVTGTFQTSTFKVNKASLEKSIQQGFALSNGGYNQGYSDGLSVGTQTGYDNGYSQGYTDGYTEGIETDTTVFTIFNGILSVGMLPVNVLLGMLNFEILGINISNFVMSLLTVAITIMVLKMFIGNSGDSGGK